MENNRQFELMRSAARQKLEGADPVQLSVLTGLCWDGRTFDTETLGIPIFGSVGRNVRFLRHWRCGTT